MKVHVIIDRQGNVMGALAEGEPSPDAEEVAIRPAHEDHELIELELSDDALQMPAEDFDRHLKEHVTKRRA